jgi:hypothetical protein
VNGYEGVQTRILIPARENLFVTGMGALFNDHRKASFAWCGSVNHHGTQYPCQPVNAGTAAACVALKLDKTCVACNNLQATLVRSPAKENPGASGVLSV